MSKILITAPLGATLKNLFLNPDFLTELSSAYTEVHIVTPLTDAELSAILPPEVLKKLEVHHFKEVNPPLIRQMLRQVALASHNKAINSGTYKIRLRDGGLTKAQKFLPVLLSPVAALIGWKKLASQLEKAKYKASEEKEVAQIVKEVGPDAVFASAASFAFDFPVIASALKMDIPVIGMVHSWDNLSSKGAVSAEFDKVIVWNDFQLKELVDHYPYSPDRVVRVGIPQLDDFYQQTGKLSKARLLKQLGLTNNAALITYATGSPKIAPQEPEIIEQIHSILLKKLKRPWRLHIRLHPQDRLERYDRLAKKKNISIEVVSKDSKRLNDGLCFKADDLVHYGELLKFSSVVLNIASTVTIEAMSLGTPVINIAFDDKQLPYYKSVRRYYDFDHMKYINALGGYPICHSVSELYQHLAEYLADPSKDAEARKRASEILNFQLDGKAGKRIVQVLKQYVKND